MTPINLHRLPTEDEAAIREHHAHDGGYERCVICRLLATIDYERETRAGMTLVRTGSGGVHADGTTNHPPIDFNGTAETVLVDQPSER